ncbi:hypothetical protein KEM52_002095, partial [Ascosphaera acerosa]
MEVLGYVQTRVINGPQFTGEADIGDEVRVGAADVGGDGLERLLQVEDKHGRSIGYLPYEEMVQVSRYLLGNVIKVVPIVVEPIKRDDCRLILKLMASGFSKMEINDMIEMFEGGGLHLYKWLKTDSTGKLVVAERVLSTSAYAEAQRELLARQQKPDPTSTRVADRGPVGSSDEELPVGGDADDYQMMLDQSVSFDPRQLGQRTEDYGSTEKELENLPMADCPKELKTELLSYQRQGLAWLLKQERPLLPKPDEIVQLWRNVPRRGYQNIVTKKIEQEPNLVSGGILADDMGLGKTLQVISLIVAGEKRLTPTSTKTTLILCPVSVISNWRDQIASHVKEEYALDVGIYYEMGKKNAKSLGQFDVVISTYGTLTTEYRDNRAALKLGAPIKYGIFGTHWRRVVLDEGHIIRNLEAQVSKAAYRITADSRWSLTGTPIVNQLLDLCSQLRFLHAPGGLGDGLRFRACLADPVGSRNAKLADKARVALQSIMATFCLRRRKDMSFMNLRLPKLSSHVLRLKLSPDEQKQYNALNQEAWDLLLRYRASNSQQRKRLWMHILEVLLRLRQCCSHWKLCEKRLKSIAHLVADAPITTLDEESTKLLQSLLELQVACGET